MTAALLYAVHAALLLAALCRATRPGGLLSGLGRAWAWWLIMRPSWLPDKPTGGCVSCTAFWLPGVPVALAAWFGGAGWWAAAVPFEVAVLSELVILL